jgi:outer membrane protein
MHNQILFKTAIIAFLFISIVSCSESEKQKIVFMDTFKVFEGFEMKKDYDQKIEKELKYESQLLDSVGVLLNSATQTKDELAVMKFKKDYYIAEKLFNEKLQTLSQKYTSEVNTRLNEYLKEYGKEKGYDFILGSSGQGNIMYVQESNEVTEDVLKFVNVKYSK